jgi:hypothetical protein
MPSMISDGPWTTDGMRVERSGKPTFNVLYSIQLVMKPYNQLMEKRFDRATGIWTVAGLTLFARPGSMGTITRTVTIAASQFCKWCISVGVIEANDGIGIAYPGVIDTSRIIEGWNVVLSLLYEPIIGQHDAGNKGHEDCIGRHEI